jgi:hypothetical protein
VPYPTIAKTRDALASILRSAVEDELIVKNPLLGLKLTIRLNRLSEEQFSPQPGVHTP